MQPRSHWAPLAVPLAHAPVHAPAAADGADGPTRAEALAKEAFALAERTGEQADVRIALRDDEVDALYNRVYRGLLGIMTADPATIDRATHLLWATHNLERIADRVTNICEGVLFLVTGRMAEIKSGTDRELETEAQAEMP